VLTGSALDTVLARRATRFPLRQSSVHRSLCNLPDQPGTPWLAYCFGGEGEPQFVTPERMTELGADRERLEESAIANLGRAPSSWTPRWVPGADGREVDVLFCIEEPHACERILDKPFLCTRRACSDRDAGGPQCPSAACCSWRACKT
jgi:hypothetical protein